MYMGWCAEMLPATVPQAVLASAETHRDRGPASGSRSGARLQVIGVQGQSYGSSGESVVHAPISLFPSKVSQLEFERLNSLMPHLSSLVHALSEDDYYLEGTLRPTAHFDSFTERLLELHTSAHEQRKKNSSRISLGLHRSDYMFDAASGKPLQA
jgi:hypothetical protein